MFHVKHIGKITTKNRRFQSDLWHGDFYFLTNIIGDGGRIEWI